MDAPLHTTIIRTPTEPEAVSVRFRTVRQFIHELLGTGVLKVLSSVARSVLLILLGHVNEPLRRKTGEFIAWPSVKGMMDLTGDSRSTIFRALRELRKHGVIDRVGGGGGSHEDRAKYRLTIPARVSLVTPVKTARVSPVTPPRVSMVETDGCQAVRLTGVNAWDSPIRIKPRSETLKQQQHDLLLLMRARQITEAKSGELLERFPEERIREVIGWADSRKKSVGAGWIIRALEESWESPQGTERRQRAELAEGRANAEAQAKQVRQAEEAKRADDERRRAADLELLDRVSPEHMPALVEKALASMSPTPRRAVERLLRENKPARDIRSLREAIAGMLRAELRFARTLEGTR